MTSVWSRIAGAAAIMVVLALAAPAAAAVPDMEGAGAHTDDVGLHWLLDWPAPLEEHAPVICRYNFTSQELTRLLIRQPVIFADVSGGPRTQRVGWRALIQRANVQTGPW